MASRLQQAQKKLERGFPLNEKDYEILMFARYGDTHTPEQMTPLTYADLENRIKKYHAHEEKMYQYYQNRKDEEQ